MRRLRSSQTWPPGLTKGKTFAGRLRDPRVDFLEQRDRGIAGSGGESRAGQAVAQEELLVLLVELENLEDAGARVLEQVACLGLADTAGRNVAQIGERLVEFAEERALPFDHLGGKGALVLPEETVFLERALVQFVTELVMLVQGFGRSHERGWFSRGSG